jgi:DNA polymerase-1
MITRINFDNPILLSVVKLVKKLFIPPQGHYILQSDLSQAELRFIAHYSEDPVMIKAYQDNIDLHSITGARIQDMSLEDFKESPTYTDDRFAAKSANFGWVFGSSISGYIDYVKKQSNILLDYAVAEKHKLAIFGTYTKLEKWHQKYKALFQSVGEVSTLFGRKRYLKEYWSRGDAEYSSGERRAINTPIQGSAGEWTIFSIVLLYFRLPKRVRIFNTVHDSTLKYVPFDLIKITKDIAKETFEKLPTNEYFNFELSVPMKLDFEISETSWGDVQEE